MRAKAWLLGWVSAAAVLCGLIVGVAANTGQEDLDEGFDWKRCAEIYAAYAQRTVRSVDDLIVEYELDQLSLLPIAAPNAELPFVTGCGRIRLFDPADFPKSFLEKLASVTENKGFAFYPVWVSESAITRDRIVTAADGEILAVVPAPKDYDPWWWLRENYGIDPEANGESWLLEIFDPARIVGRFDLVTEEGLMALAYQQTLAEAALAASPVGGGMRMMMQESYSNLQFVGAERVSGTTNTQFTIGYPDDMGTSTLCVVTCTNLLVRDWSILLYTNATTSTNIVDFVLDYTNTPQFVACFPEGWDTDGDGVSDGVEWYLADEQSDPSDPNDPPNIKGTLSYQTYSGGQTGPIYVVAVISSGSWSTNISDTLSITGVYHIINVPTGTYWLKAFRDTDWSGAPGTYEATGIYSTASMSVTGQHTGIDITLTDPDTDSDGMGDWWEFKYFENLSKTDGGDDDGDKLVNLLEYIAGTDPTDEEDTDGDGMSDDWESAYGLDPEDATDASEDEDGDGFTNWEEFDNNGSPTTATDPTDPADHPSGAVYVDDDGNDTNSGTYVSPLASISTGIAAVVTGERVVVLPGTYTGVGNRDLDFNGKDIFVVGGSGAEQTIIDCEDTARAFSFGNEETTNAVVRGFTIQNGSAGPFGGAVYCTNSSPVIDACLFVSNSASGGSSAGGAVALGERGFACVKGCEFRDNTAAYGSAFACLGSTDAEHFTIERSRFEDNEATSSGTLFFSWYVDATVRNCLIVSNDASDGGGVWSSLVSGDSLVIENCTIAGNSAGAGKWGGISGIENGEYAVVRNSIVYENTPSNYRYADFAHSCTIPGPGEPGNIADDPGFTDAEYRIGSSSPCKDAGTNQTWMVDATDLFGNDRVYNGCVDMGSYEYAP